MIKPIYNKCVDLKLGPRKNLVGQKFGRLTILSLSHRSKSAKYYWRCQCDCGNIKLIQTQDLKSEKTKSCGCLNNENIQKIKNDLTGKKFNKWTVLQYNHKTKGKGRKVFYKCRCDCGTITNVSYGNLINNQSKCCGCDGKKILVKRNRMFSKDLKNNRYGKLIALELKQNETGRSFWLCKCDCGKKKLIRSNSLISNHIRSCGNCGKYKNGILYSFPQKEICQWVNGELNYKFDNIYIDIALVNERIAIEYDEWYWHKHKFDKDCKRVNKLLNKGWKVITIRAHKNLPNQQELLKAIEYVKQIDGKIWNIITLDGWGI